VDFSRLDDVLVLITAPGEDSATTAIGNASATGPRGRQ
jgi:hypothetical protein